MLRRTGAPVVFNRNCSCGWNYVKPGGVRKEKASLDNIINIDTEGDLHDVRCKN